MLCILLGTLSGIGAGLIAAVALFLIIIAYRNPL